MPACLREASLLWRISVVSVVVTLFLGMPVAWAQAPIAPIAPVLPADAKSSIKLESVRLLALGVQDSVAVLLLPNQRMRMLKVGELVPGTQATLKEVLPTKLVLEEILPQGREIVWIYKQQGSVPNRIERFSTTGPTSFSQLPPEKIETLREADNGAALTARAKKP